MGAPNARNARSSRRASAIAAVAVLLTTLTLLAPALAHPDGRSVHHTGTAKIVRLVTADQSNLNPRVNQPVVALGLRVVAPRLHAGPGRTGVGAGIAMPDSDAPISRGPPSTA